MVRNLSEYKRKIVVFSYKSVSELTLPFLREYPTVSYCFLNWSE